jgi:hypothetical protein
MFRVSAAAAARGEWNVSGKIILLHTNDSWGCNPIPSSRTTNDEGDTYAGRLVLEAATAAKTSIARGIHHAHSIRASVIVPFPLF